MPVPKPADSPDDNALLAVLPRGEFEKLAGFLELVDLHAGDVLWESGQKNRHVYFPTTALISLVYESDNGASISIANIGRTGTAGANVVMGNVRTPDRAVVLLDGRAYRMATMSVEDELVDCGQFHALILAYTQALLVRISQNAICNRLHRIEQQLCRLLLELNDELQTEAFQLTHDEISAILGVRRESISLAAGQLRKRKLVKIGRGKIQILSIDGLRTAACECNTVASEQLSNCLKEYSARNPR